MEPSFYISMFTSKLLPLLKCRAFGILFLYDLVTFYDAPNLITLWRYSRYGNI